MLTKEEVKNALEAKWRKKQIILWTVAVGIWILFLFLVGLYTAFSVGDFLMSFEIVGLVSLCCLALFAPFILFYIYKYVKLFCNLSDYEVYEVMLDKPSTSYWYRGAIYYTVTVPLEQNRFVEVNTVPLWSSGAFASCSLEDYNNKKIRVAYDKGQGRLLVLG